MIYDDLPLFEDIRPIGTIASLAGKIGKRTRPFHIGDEVVLVIECEVTGVDHTQGKGGVVRGHKLTIVDGYELGGDAAPDLITTLAAEYAEAMGETGEPTLFDSADDLPEYDAEEHGDPEPGDCYLVDGQASRWDIVAEAGDTDPNTDPPEQYEEDVFGWVDLDAYPGSSDFGFSERERVREYRGADGELVEAILVTKASAATAGEWIRSTVDALTPGEAVLGYDEGTLTWETPEGSGSVTVGEYLTLDVGRFTPLADEVFRDLYPTLITEAATTEPEPDEDADGPDTEAGDTAPELAAVPDPEPET